MVPTIHVTKLHDYDHEINRSIIRYTGIGPRIHNESQKIWPRDTLDHKDESRKILYPDLIRIIDNENSCSKIRDIVQIVFVSLKKCNLTSLFNKHCHLDVGYFDKIPFEINYALEANTQHKRVLTLLHNVIMSIDSISKRKNFVVKTLFGCDKNFKVFQKHIEWLVRGNAKLRRIPIGHFVYFHDLQMDVDRIPWLDGLSREAKYRVLMQFIYSILRFLLELLRRYFYITLGNPFAQKLIYYRYDLWRKMQSITINKLIEDQVLYPMRYMRNVSINQFATSRIRFRLKRDSLRLICTKQNNSGKQMMQIVKAILDNVLSNYNNYELFSLINLLDGLKELRSQERPVYMVKADIKDCFPSVDQEKTRLIINNSLAKMTGGNSILVHECSCRPRDKRTSEVVRYTMDLEKLKNSQKFSTIKETKKLYIALSEFDQEYLKPHLVNCILRESNESAYVFNLINGLRQGSSLSPIFSSIYIQDAFNRHLSEFYNQKDCKLYRYVDDILFISTDLSKSQQFMVKMLNGFDDYNLSMNLNKLSCNFECPRIHDKYCRQDKYFVFYKQRIFLDSLSCKHDFDFNDIELQDIFTVSPYSDESSIRKSIRSSKISPIHLDVELNRIHGVVDNIFEIGLMLSHKVATVVLTSFKFRNLANQNGEFILRIVHFISKKIYLAIKLWKSRRVITNELNYFHVRLIVISAMRVVWNSNKLRHRKLECNRLESAVRRYLMAHMIWDYQAPLIDIESTMKRLRRTYDTSPFEQLRLPGNNKVFTEYRPLRR